MTPALTVKEYFFPYIHVAADAEFTKDISPLKIDFKTKVLVDKDPESGIYQVTLEITVNPKNENDKIPYIVELVAVGLFTVVDGWDDPERLVTVNGASILYSAAREYLITITSRGPWPPISLPTMSFNQPKTGKDKIEEEKKR